MIVLTDNGLMTIQSGNKIILSQADMDMGLPEDEEPAAKQPPGIEASHVDEAKKLFMAPWASSAIVGIALGLGGGGGGGGGGSVSPSTP